MKNKDTFKERKLLKNSTNQRDSKSKSHKTSHWTMPKHLPKKDRSDLKNVKRLYEKGKFQEALKYASHLDTIVRDEIPLAIWKEIGGQLSVSGEEQLRKEASKANHRNSKKFAKRSDDLNPKYIFSLTGTQLLVEALKNEFSIEYYIRKELANRGLDRNGEWVGFPIAKEIHQIEW